MKYIQSYGDFLNEMAMSPEEKKARRKERRAAKKAGIKLPRLNSKNKAKSDSAKGTQKKDNGLAAWLKSVETDDYQNRGGRYPRSGVPDMLQVWDNNLSGEFKNTSEREAKAWMERFCKANGFPAKKVTTEQTGDYRDDWVAANASF